MPQSSEEVELRTGLPTGSGGKPGEANAETWSLYEQEQAFGLHSAAQSPTAAPKQETKQATKGTK